MNLYSLLRREGLRKEEIEDGKVKIIYKIIKTPDGEKDNPISKSSKAQDI